MEQITSTDNPHVRLLRSLHEAKGRARHGAFLVEGLRLVETAARVTLPRFVLHSTDFGAADGRAASLLSRLAKLGAEVRPASERVLAHVSDTVTPQGVVAAVPLREFPISLAPSPSLVVILDGISDPGNAGTLLRSALAAGAGHVLCGPGTVDLYSPKVVRAAAGAHFAVEIGTDLEWDVARAALEEVPQVVLAEAQATRRHWELDWTKPSALIISNEARGASAGARRIATATVAVPMEAGVESLNAAVAGSIILYDAVRQRVTAREAGGAR